MPRHRGRAVFFWSSLATTVSAIIGGCNVTDSKYSFTAAILQKDAYQDTSDTDECTPFLCDAVLVSPTTAITAAECMAGSTASDLVLRVGLTPETQKNMTINKIVTMTTFNSTSLDDDISVLQLSAPVPREIAIAQLPPAITNMSTQLQLLGWGPTKSGVQELSTSLLSANVSLVCDDECAAKLKSCFQLDQSQLICTSSNTHGEVAYGDAGGPVVDPDGAVVALIIGSPSCAQPDGLGIKLRLDAERIQNFIRNNTISCDETHSSGGKQEDGMGYVWDYD